MSINLEASEGPAQTPSNQTNSFDFHAAPLHCAACSHSFPSVALLACSHVVAAVKGSAAERLRGEGRTGLGHCHPLIL
eukprot:1142196-Pelagomonas_calceolata.AAC.7